MLPSGPPQISYAVPRFISFALDLDPPVPIEGHAPRVEVCGGRGYRLKGRRCRFLQLAKKDRYHTNGVYLISVRLCILQRHDPHVFSFIAWASYPTRPWSSLSSLRCLPTSPSSSTFDSPTNASVVDHVLSAGYLG